MKIFISQPMSDKTKEFIEDERNKAIARIKEKFGDDVEIIGPPYNGNAVQCLGKSITLLGEADLCVFLPGWSEARECIIEHKVCNDYNINYYFLTPEGFYNMSI
jgi:hypothetical protein